MHHYIISTESLIKNLIIISFQKIANSLNIKFDTTEIIEFLDSKK